MSVYFVATSTLNGRDHAWPASCSAVEFARFLHSWLGSSAELAHHLEKLERGGVHFPELFVDGPGRAHEACKMMKAVINEHRTDVRTTWNHKKWGGGFHPPELEHEFACSHHFLHQASQIILDLMARDRQQ